MAGGRECAARDIGDEFTVGFDTLALQPRPLGGEVPIRFGVAGGMPGVVAEQVGGEQVLDIAPCARAERDSQQGGAPTDLRCDPVWHNLNLDRERARALECLDLTINPDGLVCA